VSKRYYTFFPEGTADFDALFLPLEEAKCQMETVWNTVNLLHIATDALDRDRFTQLHRRAERAFLTRHGSRDIHAALLKLKAEHAEGKRLLNGEQLRILERYLMEYKHQGFELSEKKYLELNTNWMARLSEAKRDYNFRIAVGLLTT
jgi:Zn-dependent oligopeptidase